jgi:acetolactate synthase-1/2/3 large subunit
LVENMTAKFAFQALHHASRPLLIFGWGVRLAQAQNEARRLAELIGVSIVTTWGAADLFPGAIGSFGTHGVRAANFAVQNADWILSVGTRLDTKATGSPASSFAPKAQFFMVDIDPAELRKMALIGRPVSAIEADAKAFLSEAVNLMDGTLQHGGSWPDFIAWRQTVEGWKAKYPPGEVFNDNRINPYQFVRQLGERLTSDDVIVSDTGCVLGWMMQAYPFKGERFLHAFNQTPMGYGLPAAVGAASAVGGRVTLVTGDGGLAVNITELATVARHSLAIKIILFNNRGHAMCRQTQRQWLNGEYPSTSYDGGLACPDYWRVAQAYGIPAVKTSWADAAERMLDGILNAEGPAFLELEVPQDAGIVGQIKFGEPLAEAA